MENTIFNLPKEFLNTLSGEDFEKLSAAKATLDGMQSKFDAWRANGGGDDGVKAYINSISARQQKEMADAEAFWKSLR